ncbi:NAD(P)/FAD-dependent oxidoreductase [Pontibacter sp. BT310]|uniref:Ferredoxin--NADP reductase n=1 Tax=Pontibacter populi TaxID=890055 RepID=A0ABS6X8N6_9BACT|nr:MULTISPECIES: NAD(P)/FAD-dependent oxidoreductase [Pontibacter]MBJ6116603.1 NAD(P)/FAD-dependent oxidoreductase [Pontibacter sp. BT310]MBR0569027.1 NAD(P)/FAD-dependent oxidoreductase [Microvirga sp. STS03]MBW3363456.1 NAD(P)/FAD-dependent oxidoreductase [Pontibacter populi]
MLTTDICIVGAGPVGLFAVFEAGLLKMRCHVIDALPIVGGQLSEIYPKKPIYDIPGFPEVLAGDLVKNLEKQIEPFHPTFTLGERVEHLHKQDDGSFIVETSEGTKVACKVVVIAGGLGSFEPRKPAIENLETFEGKGVNYMVRDPETFRSKKVVIAGGGDSALDWAIFLAGVAEDLTLVHRGTSFRGAPESAQKVLSMAEEGQIKLLLKSNVTDVHGNGKLNAVTVLVDNATPYNIEVDYFIPLFGLVPKLGPIDAWGLELDKSAIVVNTVDYSTNIPGVYAIGDINTYPGKLKLILCGFHEAALMAQSAYNIVYPDKKFVLKYTTVNGIQEL